MAAGEPLQRFGVGADGERLPAGTDLLIVYPYSSVTGGFAPARLRWVTVQ